MSGFSAINYALSKKLDSAILTGVVSHTVDDVNKSITFTFNDGTSSTIQFDNPKDGVDGVGIATMNKDSNNHLIVTLTNGSTIDVGELPVGSGSTVADVSETPIEIDKTALGLNVKANYSKYKVINGICFVTIELHVNAPSEHIPYGYKKINITNLPKIGFSTKAVLNVLDGNIPISLVLDTGTTDIKLHGVITAKEGTYTLQGSLSYPVAE